MNKQLGSRCHWFLSEL